VEGRGRGRGGGSSGATMYPERKIKRF